MTHRTQWHQTVRQATHPLPAAAGPRHSPRAARGRPGRFLLLLLAMAALPGGLAQGARGVQVTGPFRQIVYDRENRRVAVLTGQGLSVMGSRVPLDSVRIDYLTEKGATNLTILGTNCVYDLRAQQASSSDRLRIRTGDGRLEIAGQGFTWWYTNTDLVISNEVRTLVLPKPQPDHPDRAESAAGGPLHIASDTAWLHYQSNLVAYAGRVRAENTNLLMTCQSLDIHGTASNSVERIVARREVTVLNRDDGSRAFCDEAEYRDDGRRETVDLTGAPRWESGPREARADRVILDGTEHTLQAFGHGRFRMPHQELGEVNPLAFADAPPAPAGTNVAVVEVSAPWFLLRFPATNGPVQSATAATNVVITDTASGSTTRAERLAYERGRSLDLTGEPRWSAAGRELRAELISFDPVARALVARSNTVLRLPLIQSGQAGSAADTATAGTNRFLEIRSDFVASKDSSLHFGDRVHLDLFDGDRRLGELDCPSLDAPYRSNHLAALHARGGVEARQFPVTRTNGTVFERTFRSDSLDIGFDEQGELDSARVAGGVRGEHLATKPGQPAVSTVLWCDRADAQFAASNRLERAEATGRVRLLQGDRALSGEHAVFDGTTNVLRLTGNPVLTSPDLVITEAQTLIWDRNTGGYRVVGPFKSEWKRLPGKTNLTNLAKPKQAHALTPAVATPAR